MSPSRFRHDYLGRAPLARPASVKEVESVLDWTVMGAVLQASRPQDVIVVASGEELPMAKPRSAVHLAEYLRCGVGVCVRRTERRHPSLAVVAEAFEAELGTAHVQLFATSGGTYGFAWHYDDEDVFIVQAVGIKDYYFRPNTACPHVPASGAAFTNLRTESSPIYSARLVPGDFLYLPARWWHMAICVDDALSISVGVRPFHVGAPVLA